MNKFAVSLILIVCFGPAFGAAQQAATDSIDTHYAWTKIYIGEINKIFNNPRLVRCDGQIDAVKINLECSNYIHKTVNFMYELLTRIKTENDDLKKQVAALQQQAHALPNRQARQAQGGASAAAAAGAGAGKAQPQKSTALVAHKTGAAQAAGAGAGAPGGASFDN